MLEFKKALCLKTFSSMRHFVTSGSHELLVKVKLWWNNSTVDVKNLNTTERCFFLCFQGKICFWRERHVGGKIPSTAILKVGNWNWYTTKIIRVQWNSLELNGTDIPHQFVQYGRAVNMEMHLLFILFILCPPQNAIFCSVFRICADIKEWSLLKNFGQWTSRLR